jgi:[ribosomal protein S5]-alanine N-acetyltransferase
MPINIIETDRLIITTLDMPDAPFILALTNSPGWLEYIGDRDIKTIADAENYIINGPIASYAEHGHGLYLVSLKEDNTPVGICGLLQRTTLPDKDIGFALLPEYTGKGYALEAATAIIQYSREQLGIKRIVAITLPGNARSIRLLAALGFSFEKMVQLEAGKDELMLFGIG